MDTFTEAGWKDATPPKPPAPRQQDITAALGAPFEARLRENNGRFTLFIPELGLLARGKTLEAARAELLRLREARLREFAEEGLLDELPRPGAQAAAEAKPRLLVQLRPFLIKAAVVTALFLGAVNVISNGLRDVGYTLEKKLDGVVNWDAATIEKHRAKSAQVAEKLGPIVRELSVFFTRPEALAPAPGATPVEPAPSNSTARP